MKKILKKIGRSFIALNERYENDMHQSVLVVDGSFILPNNLALIISRVQKRFKNAKIAVLTFPDRADFIKDNFPDTEVIIPALRFRKIRHQLAWQLFITLKKRFSFIVLSSLDIPLLSLSLILGKCPVLLHNRWLEWYRIRERTVGDVLGGTKSADRNRRRRNIRIKDVIKSLGRIFIILTEVKEDDLKTRILIEDNGYTGINHILNAIRNTQKLFINPDIAVLTFEERKAGLLNNFPDINVALAQGKNKYKLAIEILKISKHKFNFIILTTLDIFPIAASFFVRPKKVLLYNTWLQWWSLDLRNIWGYFKNALRFLFIIPMSIYLLVAAGIVLLRTNFRLSLINLRLLIKRKK